MSNNFPLGVTGNEYAIAGPDYEKELGIPCPACDEEAMIEQGFQGDRWMFCLVCNQEFDINPPDPGNDPEPTPTPIADPTPTPIAPIPVAFPDTGGEPARK